MNTEPVQQSEPEKQSSERVWHESERMISGPDYKKRPKKKAYRAEPVGPAPKEYRSYGEKLKDPRWQRKRLEIMKRAGFCCQMCGDNQETLNVHHVNYTKGKEPWDYEDSNFRCYCESCHKLIEQNIRMFREFCCGEVPIFQVKTLIERISEASDRLNVEQSYPNSIEILEAAVFDAKVDRVVGSLKSALHASGVPLPPDFDVGVQSLLATHF